MKLKLRVFDPKEKRIQTINNDGRYNTEKEFEIPERMILELVEEIVDKLVDEQFYILDSINRIRRKKITYGEIEEIVRPCRTWKKIHTIISDEGFLTSRFTRISLFEQLQDIKKMKDNIKDKIHELDQARNIKPIPQKKIHLQLEPTKNISKISDSTLLEFIKDIR